MFKFYIFLYKAFFYKIWQRLNFLPDINHISGTRLASLNISELLDWKVQSNLTVPISDYRWCPLPDRTHKKKNICFFKKKNNVMKSIIRFLLHTIFFFMWRWKWNTSNLIMQNWLRKYLSAFKKRYKNLYFVCCNFFSSTKQFYTSRKLVRNVGRVGVELNPTRRDWTHFKCFWYAYKWFFSYIFLSSSNLIHCCRL